MIVQPDDSRPIGPPGRCTYCREPIGSPHAGGCVVTWESADPCPFCGSESVKYDGVDGPGAIFCDDCGAMGPIVPEPDGVEFGGEPYRQHHDAAVKAWNRRTARAALAEGE